MNMPALGAIVCLTRGYDDLRSYARLIVRNRQIYREINLKRREAGIPELPLVIFHEGNIDEAAQRHILRNELNAKVLFVDVSPTFELNAKYEGRIGYHLMCRFYAFWIWEYCCNFNFIIRIDEDIYIRRFPFRFQGLPPSIVALKSANIQESHEPTNTTLPAYVEAATGMPRSTFYRDNFPYTNVFISSVPFWRSEAVSKDLRPLSLSNQQIQHRWGDLPILGALLNVHAPTQVGMIPDLDYFHLSHDSLRVSNGVSSRF